MSHLEGRDEEADEESDACSAERMNQTEPTGALQQAWTRVPVHLDGYTDHRLREALVEWNPLGATSVSQRLRGWPFLAPADDFPCITHFVQSVLWPGGLPRPA